MSQSLKKYSANTGAKNQVVQYGPSASKQISANEAKVVLKSKRQIEVPTKTGTETYIVSEKHVYAVKKL